MVNMFSLKMTPIFLDICYLFVYGFDRIYLCLKVNIYILSIDVFYALAEVVFLSDKIRYMHFTFLHFSRNL